MEFSIEEFNSPSKSFKHNYKKICKIGNGAYGKVYKAREVKTGNIVAVKKIDLKKSENILKKINVLSSLSHPNIVKYYKYYEEDENIYIIMEYLEGGTLKEFISNEKNKINEDISRIIIQQILNALSYLHYNCDICHRDIKPENIMFKDNDNIKSLKLIDFGLCSNSFEQKNVLGNCGTLIYMAPEQISNKIYSKSVDIWSVGIILYMLLNNGKNPFYTKGESREKIIHKIQTKKIEFDDKNYPISDMGKDFIKKLLKKNSSSRYTARPALNHPWITMNKFEKIPLNVLDKYTNVYKMKELFLTALFMIYYKYYHLKINIQKTKNGKHFSKRPLSNGCCRSYINMKNNNFDLLKNNVNKYNLNYFDNFDYDEYLQRVKKSNLLQEKKFKEYREIMFMTKKINYNGNGNININEETKINVIKSNKIETVKNSDEMNKIPLKINKRINSSNTMSNINSSLNFKKIMKKSSIKSYNFKIGNNLHNAYTCKNKNIKNRRCGSFSAKIISNPKSILLLKNKHNNKFLNNNNKSITFQSFSKSRKNIPKNNQIYRLSLKDNYKDNYKDITVYSNKNKKGNSSNKLLNFKLLLKEPKTQKYKLSKKNSCLKIKSEAKDKKENERKKNKIRTANNIDNLKTKTIQEEMKNNNVNIYRFNNVSPNEKIHTVFMTSIKKKNLHNLIINNIRNLDNRNKSNNYYLK